MLFLVMISYGDIARNISSEYQCAKVPNNSIKVDGFLNEPEWNDKPELMFYEMTDGSIPRYPITAKIVWDENYIYVAYKISDPEITGISSTKCTRPAEEKEVLRNESVIEFFIDPDGDGTKYMEFHVNSSGKLADLLLDYPYLRQARKECGLSFSGKTNPDWNWNCQGLESAIHIEKNHGWIVELAIPWQAIKAFNSSSQSGQCRILLVHHRKLCGESLWWTWPVLKTASSHFPSRWGVIKFKDKINRE